MFPGEDGFDPDNVLLPHQCLSIAFVFAGLISKDKKPQKEIKGTNGETCWLMTQEKFSKGMHRDVRKSKAPLLHFIDNFLSTCAPVEATQKHAMPNQGRREPHSSPQMLKFSRNTTALCSQFLLMLPTKIQLKDTTKLLKMMSALC